jgi:hypothetical protein
MSCKLVHVCESTYFLSTLDFSMCIA